MLKLRVFEDHDIAYMEKWLNKPHVKKWYEIPDMGVSIDDWLMEVRERNGEYRWLHHFIVEWEGRPIGMCQYYNCEDSDEDFKDLPITGTYGIDYLIGEEDCIGKGIGKKMLSTLIDKIFAFPDALRISADIDENNKASAGTLLSCGFVLFDQEQCRFVLYRDAYRVNK